MLLFREDLKDCEKALLNIPYDKKVNVSNKLYKQFAHPRSDQSIRSDQLIKLVKFAGVIGNEFITLLDEEKVVLIHVSITRNHFFTC